MVAQQTSLLYQVSNAQEEDKTNADLIAGLLTDLFDYLQAERFDIKDANIFLGFFITNINENHLNKKKQY